MQTVMEMHMFNEELSTINFTPPLTCATTNPSTSL